MEVRPWLAHRRQGGGGVAIAQTIHFLYTAQYLVGGVRRVSASTSRKAFTAMETEATLAMVLEFADGTLGTVASTFAQGVGSGELRLSVYGARGVLHYRVATLDVVSPALLGDEAMHTISHANVADPHGFVALLDNFGAVVRGTAPPRVTAHDGRRALAVVEAAYDAAREERAITPAFT